MPIEMLSDDSLLEIFSLYLDPVQRYPVASETGVAYAGSRVCRRWRNVVFGSPRRLNLQLNCTAKKRVRKMLDIYPDLPIFVRHYHPPTLGMDNIVATLEHNDRIRKIDLWLVGSLQFEEIVRAMQERFPALTDLKLRSTMELVQVVDLYYNQSQVLLTEYLSVRGHSLTMLK